jgi:hypothetical protein
VLALHVLILTLKKVVCKINLNSLKQHLEKGAFCYLFTETFQYDLGKKISEPKIIVETRYITSLHTQMPNKIYLTEPY